MSISRFKYVFNLVVLLMACTAVPAASPDDRLYAPDSLIIPMDTSYQDEGMFEAYGLVYALVRQGVPVDWVIAPHKLPGDVDFRASATDLQSGATITDHGYRGGPFVVADADASAALAIVSAWQQSHARVHVHRATEAFLGRPARQLLVAPSLAVFADGWEDVAFTYLDAAGIPMSNGDPWPRKKDNSGLYACPGELCCPDCLDAAETAGPSTSSHHDGALFDASGSPRFCQFMSMHYKHPVAVPEVVAEVREFLRFPVHFLAESEAVSAFENAPDGRFLTTAGVVPGRKSDQVDAYHADDPFAQADGGYADPGGNEPSYSLSEGSFYHDSNVVMLSVQGSPVGVDDIWMNGHVDGDPALGKVSYLGGHKYRVSLPISSNPASQGTRYFLNALFEAPCSSDDGAPALSTWIEAPPGTNAASATLRICYDNAGPGVAFDAVLALSLPAGASPVSASGNAMLAQDSVRWSLGSLPADAAICQEVTVSFDTEGAFDFVSRLSFDAGLNRRQVDSGTPWRLRFGHVNLLRYGGVSSTTPGMPPNSQIFVASFPVDPALDPVRDLEVTAFESALAFPHDVSDLLTGSPPFVYYELEGDNADTLRVGRPGGKIVISF